MPEVFATPDDFGTPRASEAETSLAVSLSAQAANTLDPKNDFSTAALLRAAARGIAGGYMPHDYDGGLAGPAGVDAAMALHANEEEARAAIPDTPIEDARARIRQEGLENDVHLPDQPSIKQPVLDLMINEGHMRRDRDAAIARGPHGYVPGALGFITSIGVGMLDPLQVAAFAMPLVGEVRFR
jgi:hypothetical protein